MAQISNALDTLKGDTTALKLCLDRIIPVRKGRPLPALNKQTDETSVEALLRSVLSGEISPEEGKEVIGLVEGAARVAATQLLTEMRQRQLDALQKAGASGGVVMVPMLDPSKLSTQALEEVLSVITH
ncbi:hypothetical protein LKR43_07690 [Pusillimonas sp. MFBS29]|uniref:hypothetical protein n=1 Tax=Pusillimonas sp. MFBS29 TaxID=2886690 RepID=UPI001D0FE42F|nr:hypothetical protein [Pusillimonas sp. MFBS29]MCC2596219.1 hypothetical protein [Pusillimonas sp. MFBS29]